MKATISSVNDPSPVVQETKPIKWLEIVLWFLVSAIASTYSNTAFLREFGGDAVALTLFRFVGSAILGLIGNVAGLGGERLSFKRYFNILPLFILPALFLLGANLFNSISLDRGGITLTYVVKAGIPLVTVIICLFRGQRVSWGLALTLMPTVIGVALSAWADTDFTWEGFAAAWLSTVSQAFLNVTSKTSIQQSGLSGQRSQFVLVSITSALMLIGDVAFESINYSNILEKLAKSERAQVVLVLTAVSYHLEYVLNFIVTENVAEVHFSVLDVARRLSIIVAGAFLFGKILTGLNIFGVVLALCGVLMFNQVKRKDAAAAAVQVSSADKKTS